MLCSPFPIELPEPRPVGGDRFPSRVLALCLSDLDAFTLSLFDLFPFKLREGSEHGQHEFARRRVGVNLLLVADKSYTLFVEGVDDIQQILCGAPQYNLVKCRKPVKRLWISSLEESAIKDGFAKLKNSSEYDNLYQEGFCRAKADWLVGMNGSRLFSVRYNAHLNTGRVQTPTLAMIVKRDDEIANFIKQKYFTVDLDIQTSSESWRIFFHAGLFFVSISVPNAL